MRGDVVGLEVGDLIPADLRLLTAADIVLLRKSLAVLAGGIVEGRRTFANITKYILNTVRPTSAT